MGGEGSSIVKLTSIFFLFNLLLLALDVPLTHSSVRALTWVDSLVVAAVAKLALVC